LNSYTPIRNFPRTISTIYLSRAARYKTVNVRKSDIYIYVFSNLIPFVRFSYFDHPINLIHLFKNLNTPIGGRERLTKYKIVCHLMCPFFLSFSLFIIYTIFVVLVFFWRITSRYFILRIARLTKSLSTIGLSLYVSWKQRSGKKRRVSIK